MVRLLVLILSVFFSVKGLAVYTLSDVLREIPEVVVGHGGKRLVSKQGAMLEIDRQKAPYTLNRSDDNLYVKVTSSNVNKDHSIIVGKRETEDQPYRVYRYSMSSKSLHNVTTCLSQQELSNGEGSDSDFICFYTSNNTCQQVNIMNALASQQNGPEKVDQRMKERFYADPKTSHSRDFRGRLNRGTRGTKTLFNDEFRSSMFSRGNFSGFSKVLRDEEDKNKREHLAMGYLKRLTQLCVKYKELEYTSSDSHQDTGGSSTGGAQ